MIYSILCGSMGIVFTILLYCIHLLDQKQIQPHVDVVLDFDSRGSEIAKNLETQNVTVGNLVAHAAEIKNLTARPLVADISDKEVWKKWLFNEMTEVNVKENDLSTVFRDL